MADLVAIDPEPVSQRLVETIEQVVDLASDGALSSVAVAYVLRDGSVGCIWSDLPSRAAMLGSIARLSHRLNLEADE